MKNVAHNDSSHLGYSDSLARERERSERERGGEREIESYSDCFHTSMNPGKFI